MPSRVETIFPFAIPTCKKSLQRFLGMVNADQGTNLNIPFTGLKIDHVMVAGHSIVCDISSGLPRPLVSATWVQTVFYLIHSLSHPGVKTSVQLVLRHFVWQNAKKDISRLARACLVCQTAKVQNHTRQPVLFDYTIFLRNLHIFLVPVITFSPFLLCK